MTEVLKNSSKDRLVVLGAGVGLLVSACSVKVEGAPYPKESWGELEIKESVETRSLPGIGGKEELQLKVGERVLGVCLSYPSWESATIATGFMKIKHLEKEYYAPTFAGYAGGMPQNTFQIPEQVLDETYLRCSDKRRL